MGVGQHTGDALYVGLSEAARYFDLREAVGIDGDQLRGAKSVGCAALELRKLLLHAV